MYLRNVEGSGAYRSAEFRTNSRTNPATVENTPSTAVPPSRGAFFEMMLATELPPSPASARRSAEAIDSPRDENPSPIRGLSHEATPRDAAVRNSLAPSSASSMPVDPDTAPPLPAGPEPPATGDPVTVLNQLLSKLGYEPSAFNAKVTSTTISVPGLSYAYPMIEVTVNGERVGFHLPSAMKDPRHTAANISAMMGRPVMNYAEFA